MVIYLNTNTLLLQSFPVPSGDDWIQMLEQQPHPHYLARVEDGVGVWYEPPLPVPQSCTRRQGRLALLSYDLLNRMEETIENIVNPTEKRAAQIEYEADTWERQNRFVISMWEKLGGTEETLDEIFILANTL